MALMPAIKELQAVQDRVEKRYQNGEIEAEDYRTFQRELMSTERQLKSLISRQNEAGNASNTLKSKISEQEKELADLKNEYSNVVLEQGKNSTAAKELAEKIKNLDSQLGKDKEKLEEAESAANDLTEQEEDLNDETEKAEKKMLNFGTAMTTAKKLAGGFVTAMGTVANAVGTVMLKLGQGVFAFGKYSVEQGKEFKTAVSQIAATMGTTTDQITELEAKARELGANTKFTATEAAEGLNILAQSGLSAEEQIAAVDEVLNLAAAGTLSMENAASYTVGAIKGFGDTMENAQYYNGMTLILPQVSCKLKDRSIE